jgi:antitoxin component YwqK of YwqJK toxin-antitoxin module
MAEVNFKNDKKEGLWTYWYENGQKEREENYKDGELVKETTWKQSINR